MMNKEVLLLNSTYEILGIIKLNRAMCLMFREHNPVRVEKYLDDYITSGGGNKWQIPSVIRLQNYVHTSGRRKNKKVKKEKIFERDWYLCGYCIKKGDKRTLTLDHVIPKSKGGSSKPENLVTACLKCNQKKGDKTLEESGMKLIADLTKSINDSFEHYKEKRVDWKDYII